MKKILIIGAASVAITASMVWMKSETKLLQPDTGHVAPLSQLNVNADTDRLFNEVMQSNALMQEQITQLKKQINQLVAHSEEAQVFEKASVSQAKTLAQTELQQKQNADKLFKEEQQAAEQQMQQQIQLLDDALAAEAYDPDWSLSAQSELNTAFLAENMASIHLNNVECKATICKLDITPPSDQALEDSFRRISSLKWPGSGFIYMDNASGNVTLYLAKEGHSIPQVN